MPTPKTEANETPWAVWCSGLMEEVPSCGKQFLTEEEYTRQLDYPDRGWACPLCGAEASWDDDHFEKFESAARASGQKGESR